MKIIIEYESSWRNSFLDGCNNEALPKKGRGFIGSMTNLKNEENFIKRAITIDTVMGVLNRLIGDQKKLYQARDEEKYGRYYFKDLEPLIDFEDSPSTTDEMIYLRNMSGNTDRNSFTGMININHSLFTSDFSKQLWMVLNLNFDELIRSIFKNNFETKDPILDPREIVERVKDFKDIKFTQVQEKENVSLEDITHVNNYFKGNESINFQLEEKFPNLKKVFSDIEYIKNEKVVTRAFYCSALYLQAIQLSKKYEMKGVVLKGFSVNGLTPKNFMSLFTGGEKKIYGNPYVRKERIKGQGEVVSMLTKARGELQIKIDVSTEKAKEIRSMIECAGVSSFYLGKKGLAYVSTIRI